MSKKKIKVHLFIRKKINSYQNSIEKIAKTFERSINNNSDNFEIILKICPRPSSGLLNRVYNIFWALFNQGDINHIFGDINFISCFMNKKKQ